MKTVNFGGLGETWDFYDFRHPVNFFRFRENLILRKIYHVQEIILLLKFINSVFSSVNNQKILYFIDFAISTKYPSNHSHRHTSISYGLFASFYDV